MRLWKGGALSAPRGKLRSGATTGRWKETVTIDTGVRSFLSGMASRLSQHRGYRVFPTLGVRRKPPPGTSL